MATVRTLGDIGMKKKILARLFPIQCKILFVYMCRKRVLHILETQAPFPPLPTHTAGKV